MGNLLRKLKDSLGELEDEEADAYYGLVGFPVKKFQKKFTKLRCQMLEKLEEQPNNGFVADVKSRR